MITAKNLATALLCSLLLVPVLHGKEQPRPETTGEELALVGEARLKVMFWSIYESRLYSPDGVYQPGKRPLRLEIQYLRDIKSKDLVSRTAKEWDSLGVDNPARDAWLDRLQALWPDVEKNDVLALRIDKDERSHFYMNGNYLGAIEEPAFGEHFTAIWLSPDTSRPEIRLALLGRKDD
jgi:hypothetical protein